MLFQHWGATEAEIDGPVAGDDLIPNAGLIATRAIDLDAPPSAVFPWLRQIGYGRAGWYSYDWIDNLGRRSATRIHSEWQGLEQGDPVPGGPIAFEATVLTVPHSLVLTLPGGGPIADRIQFSLAFDLREAADGTRLVSRVKSTLDFPMGRLVERFLLGPGDGIMVRRQLLNLAKRAELPAMPGR